MMEFHISQSARERYQFPEKLFSYTGNVIFADMAACRTFAYRMNQIRDADKYPELAIHAGALFAMGMIDEASHVLMARYREQFDKNVMVDALAWFSSQVGPEALESLLLTFVEHFPGSTVIRGLETPKQWLAGSTDGRSHREAALEELLMLWTANRNEAFKPFEELFEEKTLAEKTVYRQVTQQLPGYFATRPLIPIPGAKPVNFLDLLRAPSTASPTSLREQLDLLRRLWRPLLGDSLDRFLLMASEILHEEELAIWMQFNPPAVQARTAAEEAARRRRERGEQQWPSIASHAEVPVFGDPAHEYEKFSQDTAWMPTTVLIAKSTYVWLAQLSKQYGCNISRLDEIPDEELRTLAHRGLNSLWLIGIWERSRASKTIKLLCGNQDAVASAYSLFDYSIADDLGGEPAYINLRDRAYRNGIRLASDMVPNHMGIDSPWVVEHPDWFMSRNESPYPAYSFEGPDLSADSRVEIKIDDHYYTQTDAAVVFRRRDCSSGETRFIYHGNDGTSFPWNDTAQLDYLNPAVREHVIQTILHVARLFPVIRFDAAMTLAKRHFHRLWFPGPGSSGAIPSRAEYAMSQADFDRAMPHEFWREVVDRVAAEVPGTLLLAEAFWLMEGYFVRTLGMHRVYNSAFMVMLRDEDNANYRSVIKNTLEFDADIMKRYVNFMSNPDERTAIDQFGKGDKCFGVAALMATLPGLPMFGHGQVEGYTEKYGMEYRRPRYDESPDHWLVERHDREIAPLLKRRRLFAESYNFLLYDLYEDSGSVDENIFAYSNQHEGERALVVYNNRYGTSHGTVRISAAYADKGSGQLRQRSLWDGLGLKGGNSVVVAWRDSLTGLEYLRRGNDLAERGLTLDLHAYQCYVFLDWHELTASQEKQWDRLCDLLGGRGVPSLDEALVNMELRPVHEAFRAVLEPGLIRLLADLGEVPHVPGKTAEKQGTKQPSEFFERSRARFEALLPAVLAIYARWDGPHSIQPIHPNSLAPVLSKSLRAAVRIPTTEALFAEPWTTAARRVLPNLSPLLPATALWGPVIAWCVLETLSEAIDPENPKLAALSMFDRLRLRVPFAESFSALGLEGEQAWRAASRVKVLLLVEAGVGREVETAPEAKTGLSSPRVSAAGKLTKAAETLVAEATSTISPLKSASKSTENAFKTSEISPIPTVLWQDPDVKWLSGAHIAGDHEYLVRESYEELLCWLQLPSLLNLTNSAVPNRKEAARLSKSVDEALLQAETAGYQLDVLLKTHAVEKPAPVDAPDLVSESLVPHTPIAAKPVVPVNPEGPPEDC